MLFKANAGLTALDVAVEEDKKCSEGDMQYKEVIRLLRTATRAIGDAGDAKEKYTDFFFAFYLLYSYSGRLLNAFKFDFYLK